MSLQDPVKFPTYVSNTKVQSTFVGGSDTLSADTQVKDDSYVWLINGRCRFGQIDPIKRHTLQNVPIGKKQGLIAVGNTLVIFVAGTAYYQVDGNTAWIRIIGPDSLLSPYFKLDPTVDQYWTCAVPASTLNIVRKSSTGNANDPVNLATNFTIAGTPAAILVQDGINQPWIITVDSSNPEQPPIWSSRPAGTFNSWANISQTLIDREYVPIGKQMILFNGNTLFIVAPDGLSVYRSITGRPLDFMVIVDTNGNKLSTELDGGASKASFAADFNIITCLANINIPDSFIYATAYDVRIIIADYVNTIFGEPVFKVSAQIQAGIVNQYSELEILGDYCFIDFEGIVSFDAVQQLKFNGRNSIFSLPLTKLLHKIKQKTPVCIAFDNYALFNLDTVWGNLIAVYDILLQKWVSFDITDVLDVKQFAIVETEDASKLYCITKFDEVYRMFDPNNSKTYLAQLHTKAFCAGETDTEIKCQKVRLFFNGGTYTGTSTVIEYVDEKNVSDSLGNPINRVSKKLEAAIAGILYPVRPPVIPNSISRVDNPTFNFSKGLTGKKLSYIIQWDNDARLVEFQTTISWKKSDSSLKESNQVINTVYGTNS